MEIAVAEGRLHSVEVTGHLVEAEEVDGIISLLRKKGADLLVIGLQQHSFHVARLWSTVGQFGGESTMQRPGSSCHAAKGKAMIHAMKNIYIINRANAPS
jgi:hypothetical protein